MFSIGNMYFFKCMFFYITDFIVEHKQSNEKNKIEKNPFHY